MKESTKECPACKSTALVEMATLCKKICGNCGKVITTEDVG
jgi:RNA polymerase subunit RPABC4/transcription elongation factor Spt4